MNKFERKLEQFQDDIESDLVWRKKEISDLLFIAKGSENNKALLKSTILLIYAHWEGYIKNSSCLYLKFVSEQKKQIGDLCLNFKAIALKSQIAISIEQNNNINLQNEIKFLETYESKLNLKFKINVEDSNIVTTNSNLSPKIFEKILKLIGLKYRNSIKIRKNYLDEKLVGSRNNIGHGGKYNTEDNNSLIDLDISEIETLRDIVFTIIDSFTEDLIEFTSNEYYLENKKEEKELYDARKDEVLETSLGLFIEI